MLFNSQIFLLLFLPLALAAWYAFAHRRGARTWVLIAASFIFYGYWDVRLVPLLAGSIVVNWVCAQIAVRRWPGALVILGVAVNLVVLGVFKYADFFAGTLAFVLGEQHQSFRIVLPLGISFFTFQQISYLMDLRDGKASSYRFADYALYVSFFPQLIAGPIVRHGEMIPQLAASPLRDGLWERMGRGTTLLTIGLIKKVVFADNLARIADPAFLAALNAEALSSTDAWLGTLAFTFQIYFDFSGYSDMAIGLGLMFGLVLPTNFNAPYSARSISDFWRRWHMTLSSFLRDYLYIRLGGSRHGAARQTLALAVTMLLGGLWHGAAWTFVAWGGLHGLALAINHAFRRLGLTMPTILGWALTMLFVIHGWVLFRAETFEAAQRMLGAMWSTSLALGEVSRSAWLLLPAAAVALAGPTSQRASLQALVPRGRTALACGLALAGLVILTGGWHTPEFIYFQF